MPFREYYQKHKEHCREYNRQYLRRYRKTNPQSKYRVNIWQKYHKQYFEKEENAKKLQSRRKTIEAIRIGVLTRGSCETIDCTTIAEAHHDDYDKPLGVRWLCRQHHAELHFKRRRTLKKG